MTCIPDNFGKVMVFVAHPDDETIACSGLLQRATVSLVVFGVDGAPPHYGFEKKFGSLAHYSEVRYLEASRALASIPECSFRRLTRQDGSWFVDQHLFMELPEAFTSLCKIAGEFQPDLLISHAFEGGHLDHDTCHVLAKSLARTLAVGQLEFPLYWNSKPGQDVFQEFREPREDDFVVQLSQTELIVKRRMLTEYRTQQNITSVFHPETERFRPVAEADGSKPTWSTYPFQNRGKPWKAGLFFQKIDDFQRSVSTSARREIAAIKE
jgi:LmbE family N-acetylglucosaminyl deacetylase